MPEPNVSRAALAAAIERVHLGRDAHTRLYQPYGPNGGTFAAVQFRLGENDIFVIIASLAAADPELAVDLARRIHIEPLGHGPSVAYFEGVTATEPATGPGSVRPGHYGGFIATDANGEDHTFPDEGTAWEHANAFADRATADAWFTTRN